MMTPVVEAFTYFAKRYSRAVRHCDRMAAQGRIEKDGRTYRILVEVGPAGTGYWNRDRDEILLIGTRGDIPCPAMGTQSESVWFAERPKIEGSQRGRHSAKPEDAYLWVEKHYPNLPRIELNARTRRTGWDAWGPEAPVEEISAVNDNPIDTGDMLGDAAGDEPDDGGDDEVSEFVEDGERPFNADADMPAFLRRREDVP
jgi:hypothetical protein